MMNVLNGLLMFTVAAVVLFIPTSFASAKSLKLTSDDRLTVCQSDREA